VANDFKSFKTFVLCAILASLSVSVAYFGSVPLTTALYNLKVVIVPMYWYVEDDVNCLAHIPTEISWLSFPGSLRNTKSL